jgi:hypothetical protein
MARCLDARSKGDTPPPGPSMMDCPLPSPPPLFDAPSTHHPPFNSLHSLTPTHTLVTLHIHTLTSHHHITHVTHVTTSLTSPPASVRPIFCDNRARVAGPPNLPNPPRIAHAQSRSRHAVVARRPAPVSHRPRRFAFVTCLFAFSTAPCLHGKRCTPLTTFTLRSPYARLRTPTHAYTLALSHHTRTQSTLE